MDDFEKDQQVEIGLVIKGSGGAMMKEVSIVKFSCVLNKRVDLSEGRRIYVSLVEDLLKRINNDEAVRPHLSEYPGHLQSRL